VLNLRIFRPEYLELVVVKVFMNLKSEASRTYLSFLWWILEPVMTMSVFYVVFGVLLNRRTDDFIAFLLVGLVTWQWFSNTISHGMSAIHHNSRVILSVDIPKEIFPLIEILMDVVKFSLVLVLLLGFLWIFGFPVNPQYFALPGLLVIQFMLICSITLLTAAVVPFFPDIKFLVMVLLQLTFFLSGIFYDPSSIPVEYQQYFFMNPMALLVDSYRLVLLEAQSPDWSKLFIVACGSSFGVLLTLGLLAKLHYAYPRVLQP